MNGGDAKTRRRWKVYKIVCYNIDTKHLTFYSGVARVN